MGTVVVVVVLVVGGGGEKGKVKGSENWRGRGKFILPFYEFMYIHINRKNKNKIGRNTCMGANEEVKNVFRVGVVK